MKVRRTPEYYTRIQLRKIFRLPEFPIEYGSSIEELDGYLRKVITIDIDAVELIREIRDEY